MKKFSNLVIRGTHQELVEALAELAALQSPDFVYEPELSDRYARNI